MIAQPMSTGTVGIVLVSHSAELAAGAAHLAAQVSGGTVTIVAAGGTDDDDLGTSAAKVARGIAEAGHGAGGVVLPADAPFVEGAVAATVTAAAGGDLKAVAAAAEEARHVRKL